MDTCKVDGTEPKLGVKAVSIGTIGGKPMVTVKVEANFDE